MTDQHFALFDTRIGLCAIAWGPRGINGTQLPMGGEQKIRTRISAAPCRRHRGSAHRRGAAGDRPDRQNCSMASRTISPTFRSISMAFPISTAASTRSLAPFRPGKTLTYGDIAKRLGGVELSRDVGQALGRNPCPIVVPCHRVLAAGNKPGGFSANGGVVTKLKMLEIEGAPVNHTPSSVRLSQRSCRVG